MKKGPYWVIGAGIIAIAVFYFFFIIEFRSLIKNANTPSPAPTVTPTPIFDKSINFNHVGNFVMSDPKLKSDQFYLMYETPGSPAMTVRLYFTTKSKCLINHAIEYCSRPVFNHGDRIQVLGTKIDNYVIVKEAIFLQSQ